MSRITRRWCVPRANTLQTEGWTKFDYTTPACRVEIAPGVLCDNGTKTRPANRRTTGKCLIHHSDEFKALSIDDINRIYAASERKPTQQQSKSQQQPATPSKRKSCLLQDIIFPSLNRKRSLQSQSQQHSIRCEYCHGQMIQQGSRVCQKCVHPKKRRHMSV